MYSHKNIIFVDDDADDRLVFREVLSRINRQFIYNDFDNANEVMDYLYCPHILAPNLIFLDINMPGKDGFHVLKNIKKTERLKDIPVVIFSTSANPADMQKASKFGAQGYSVKPASLSGYTMVIKMALEKFVYHKEPAEKLVRLLD